MSIVSYTCRPMQHQKPYGIFISTLKMHIYTARTPFVLGTSSPPVRVTAIRIARARALKADSALRLSMATLRNAQTAITHMWWLFSPRMQSMWRVTPAANANDWSRCGTISVDTGS